LLGNESNAMPRFYVHFRHGEMVATDDTGLDLPGLEEANAAALVSAREILAENVKFNADNPLTEIIITDETGTQLATIASKDILPGPLR
jgi:hypothetical protein